MTTIENLQPEHFDLVAGWLSRPEINQWLTGEWRGRQANPSLLGIALRNRRNRMFLVRHDSRACGLVALADIDSADRIGMVWYLLGESELAGRGVISEAVRQLASVAFSELRLSSIHGWIMEGNTASRRVLEKSGFLEVGRLRRSSVLNGNVVNRIYFDLIAPEA